jgi:AcrR family transcriptional regulator
VTPTKAPTPRQRSAEPHSAAQARIVTAAQKLFAQRGVGGTSLQMIANELGVSKAAIYHQYHTKDAIIRAVAEAEIDRLEAVLDVAEGAATPAEARDAAIAGIVDLAVTRRREVSTLLNDPIIGKLFARDRRLLRVLDRLHHLLVGSDASTESEVATAMLIAAISGATIHPLVVGRDDDTLRTQLLHLARRFLGLPG